MLSGHKIGAEHVTYYLSYVERGGEPGRWLGRAAEALGLEGVLQAQDFANLAEGRHPDGSQLLEQVHSDRVMGWDFTMSAPKSLSLLATLHPDEETRAALRGIHDQAVAAGLAYLEDTGGAARRGDGGRDGHVGAELVIAGFTHKTSRESEPDLHEHGIVLNVGRGEDGRWTSIDSRWLFAHKAGAEAIYRAELYHGAAQLGISWSEPDQHGNREIVGFERAELRAWSTRRVNIEAEVERVGGSGRRATEAAALATRKTKVDVEFTALTEQWRQRAEAEGLSARRLGQMITGRDRTVTLSPKDLDKARDRILGLGPGGLLEKASAFTADELARAWVDHLPTGAPRAKVDRLVQDTLDDPRIVALVVADHHGQVLSVEHRLRQAKALRLVRTEDLESSRCRVRYSTQQMLAMEAQVVEAVAQGRDAGMGMVNPQLVEEALARHPTLTLDQVEMVRAITTTGHGIEAVVGPPGSGKTFALSVAREIWNDAGYRLQGVAPSGKAAVGLGQASGIDSTTLADLVDLATPTKMVAGGILVLDEAGMAGTADISRLLDLAKAVGTKVVAMGDPRQIAAVAAGGTFTAMVERFGAVELTENGRQAEAWERDAIAALRDGRSGEAVGAYVAHGRLVVADNPEDLMRACVADWWAARAEGQVAMYTVTRDQVWQLNALARARMAEAGRLTGPELVVGAIRMRDYALPERAFAAGDEVLLSKNRSKVAGDVAVHLADGTRRYQGVKNGQRGVVEAVEQATGRLTIRHQDGRHLTLSADYVGKYLAHGYATTAHKAQGETVGQAARAVALGIITEAERRKGRAFVYGLAAAELGLVMASRATDETRFYSLATAEASLYDEGSQPEPIDAAMSLARAWGRSDAMGMASDELERQQAIKRLAAGTSSKDLAARRQFLAELGRGDQDPAVALKLARAQRRSAVAEVTDARRVLAEAILDVEDAREITSPANQAGEDQPAPGRPSAEVAANQVLEAEARAETALLTTRAAEGALRLLEAGRDRRAAAVTEAEQATGGDRRKAAAELEILDEALATQRRWSGQALAAQPPAWATDVLGPHPLERAQALRWRQGLTLLADARTAPSFQSSAQDDDPMLRALGQAPSDPFAKIAWLRQRASVDRVRLHLGLEVPDRAVVGQNGSSERRNAALARLTEASRRRWESSAEVPQDTRPQPSAPRRRDAGRRRPTHGRERDL